MIFQKKVVIAIVHNDVQAKIKRTEKPQSSRYLDVIIIENLPFKTTTWWLTTSRLEFLHKNVPVFFIVLLYIVRVLIIIFVSLFLCSVILIPPKPLDFNFTPSWNQSICSVDTDSEVTLQVILIESPFSVKLGPDMRIP